MQTEQPTEQTVPTPAAVPAPVAPAPAPEVPRAAPLAPRGRGRGRGNAFGGDRRGGRRSRFERREEREYDQKVIDLARVTRVMAGGKRMRFRACVVIGDHKGKVGMGLAKGADVTMAIGKAVKKAEKSLIRVPMVNDTIPHAIELKFGAAHIILKPASKGRGIIAGGSVRQVLELSGVKNVMSKMRGSNNKINNVRATLEALATLQTPDHYQNLKVSS